MAMRIAELWRYPVKSMAGEPLAEAQLTVTGIPGDRVVHVRGPEGIRTSRRQYRMLGLKGTLSPAGRPLVNGLPWDSEEVLALVRDAEVLRDIGRRFGGRLALNADVVRSGVVRVGDEVRLVRPVSSLRVPRPATGSRSRSRA